MSIKYNGKIVAGNYKAQVVSDADTINKGILRIATQDEVNEALSNDTAITPYYLSYKQNKLTSGKNISIQNDTINCNIMPDSSTIVQNDDNTFTSIGQKTPTNTIKIDWEGTSAEYEVGIENGTIKADWFCYITDDEQIVEFDNTTDKYDLEASNIYTLGKYTMTDIEGYDILEAEYLNPNSIKKIDILLEDNFTTVGIPVITEDRILNQTSENNYIYIDDLNFDNKDFYINTKLVPNKDVTTNNILYIKSKSRENYIQCNIENNNIYIKAFDGVSELNSEVIELQLNIYYNIQVGFTSDKNQLYLKVFDINGVLLKIVSIQLNSYGAFFGKDSVTLYIGYDLQNYLNNISVDLNSFKVYVEETCIYRICLRMPYIYSAQNSKIVDYKYKDRILDWIDLNNSSEYYIINTEDKTFVLPNIQNPLSKIIYSSDRSLNNLTEEGEKHFINKSQITNCLLEVPQRIKYTLENGTLIIHKGSIVIVPYGIEDLSAQYLVGSTFLNNNFKVYDTQFADEKFFVWVEVTKDISHFQSFTTSSNKIFNFDISTGHINTANYSESGDTNVSTSTWTFKYNQTTNLIGKSGADTTVLFTDIHSLPFALGYGSSDGFSIHQIFNGMGYIGSTVWVDKGVKGLIPNGRNEDGSLRNIGFNLNRLYLNKNTTLTSVTNRDFVYQVYSEENGAEDNVYFSNQNYTVSQDGYIYNASGQLRKMCVLGKYSTDSNRQITSFNPKQPFRVADVQDVVNKTGDTLTGALNSYTMNPLNVYTQQITDSTTAPSTNIYSAINFFDSKDQRYGAVEGEWNTNGYSKFGFVACRLINGSYNYTQVKAWVDANGVHYFQFPKCTSKATTTSSASDDKVAVVVYNYLNGTSWIRIWSDGWIEQGGCWTGSTGTTITLVRSFSNNDWTLTYSNWEGTCYANKSGTNEIIFHDVQNANKKGYSWYACGY